MIEEVQFDAELRGRDCLVTAEVYWHWDKCECSSEVGDQYVTYTWDEVSIDELVVLGVDLWTDSNEYMQIPESALNKDDMQYLRELAQEYIIRNN